MRNQKIPDPVASHDRWQFASSPRGLPSCSRSACGRAMARGSLVATMPADAPLLAALPAIAGFAAWPAFVALCRRRAMREASEVAVALAKFATVARLECERSHRCEPLDEDLSARVRQLRVPEIAALQLALDLPQSQAELLADTAQRLALRLKRRIAFERKMLARTASGRRRGAIAAIIPLVILLLLHAFGLPVPVAILAFVTCLEAFGCWLLWRLASVGI
jgi:hypothetical protein